MNHHYKPDAPKSWLATLAPLDHWFSSTLDLILDDKIQSPEEEAQSYPLRCAHLTLISLSVTECELL